jgi:hypothetical protein
MVDPHLSTPPADLTRAGTYGERNGEWESGENGEEEKERRVSIFFLPI